MLGACLALPVLPALAADDSAQFALGKKLFLEGVVPSCAVCHTLQAAGAEGAVVRQRIADTVLEGLVIAALREINRRQQQGDRLAFAQRLLSSRLELMEKSRAGLDALECGSWKGRDIERLRDSLAANAAELAAHHSAGSGLDATLEGVISTLEAADAVIHAEKLSLSLDAMNIVVPPGSPDASIVPLLEFSTATPGSSRRVAFLASVPRHAVAERKLDLAAGMRLL